MSKAAKPAFAALVRAFARKNRVSYGGRGFGAQALRVDGRIFAMLDSKGDFVVKLPRARADELVARGQAAYFNPGHGRLMKEWVVVIGRRPSWMDLAREAYAYVGGK